MLPNLLPALALFGELVASHSISLPTRSDARLNVFLESFGDSNVRIKITNESPEPIRLLKVNTLLERFENEKLTVRQNGEPVRFAGIDFHLLQQAWKEEHFLAVAAGETVENVVDVARSHDMSAGGTFEIQAAARIEYALPGETQLHGAMPYQSNIVTVTLKPGAVAAPASPKRTTMPGTLSKRSRIAPGSCTPGQLVDLTRAMQIGSRWAAKGALEAAKPRSAVWNKYLRFNDTSDEKIWLQTKRVVGQRLSQVSADLAGGLVAEIHCKNDFYVPEYEVSDVCAAYPESAIAFAYRATCQIALCKKAWTMPIESRDCVSRGAVDMASTLIHELTHCTVLGRVGLQPATDDFAYDYEDTQNDDFMTPGMALQNAQSSALFAKASFVGGPMC